MTDTTDPRPMYARALDQTGLIIDSVRPDQLGDPTPCTEYDVRSLLSHMVGGVTRVAVAGEGGDALAVAARADGVPDDGWPAAFRPPPGRRPAGRGHETHGAAPGGL